MSTLSATAPVVQSAARTWFDEHLGKLSGRCRNFVRRLPRGEREEAAAEVLASIFHYTLQAERQGKLHTRTARPSSATSTPTGHTGKVRSATSTRSWRY